MAYKFKPHKAISKRVKVTGTGKIKHRREKSTHLMSRRSAALKRRVGRAGVLFEGHARNLRAFLGLSRLNPNRVRHERALASNAPDPTGVETTGEPTAA